jgi:hypothetical protein
LPSAVKELERIKTFAERVSWMHRREELNNEITHRGR